MRSASLSGARLVLLAGPSSLAFFTGGYFSGPRAWAGLMAWLLVVVAAVVSTNGLPRSPGAALAVGGLAALAILSLLSMLWAPIASDAYHAGQIIVLYLGTLLAASLLLGGDRAPLLVEPALVAGAVIVVGYGLSERLLPGLLRFARSVSAQGRLEQPLTYWNGMGELAALGLVLAARLAGERSRPSWLRAIAAAAFVPLGMALYISFSRGALFAGAAGLLALVVLAPKLEQLAAVLLAVAASVLAALAAAPFGGVTGLSGSLASREQGGAVTLGLLVVVAIAVAVVQLLMIRHVGNGALRLPARAPAIATAVVCVGLAGAIVLGAKETSAASQTLSAGSSRLVTLRSNRYEYWGVALRAFASEPIVGVGAGNWSVYWLRWRKISEFATDAHSLPLQTLAELGLLGAAALLAFLVGVALVARNALRTTPLAAGPVAGLIVYIVHAPLDWDWQMPAVTLIAILLAGALTALSGANSDPGPGLRTARSELEPAPA